MEGKNKKIYEQWWFWLIISITIIVLSFIFVFNKENISSNSESIGSAGINKEEFNKIELGMSQTTVTKIIDVDNLWINDDIYNTVVNEISKSSENHIYKYTYKYLGETSGYAMVTYTADYSNGDIFVLPTVSEKQDYDLK